MGGGAAAEGDEEIGGSQGAKERRRARGVERRGEGAQLGCSVVRRLAREHPERAPGRPGGRRAGGDGVRGCGPCVPPRAVRAALICVRGGRAHPPGDEASISKVNGTEPWLSFPHLSVVAWISGP